ncbi:hypothetical protein ACP70R_007684 [Stipagrostis hirtigluma subsp. patula]
MSTSSKFTDGHGGCGGGGSTSTISPETATGWDVLKVEGYSQTKGALGVGSGAKSAVFAVGGHGWRIAYYPNGYNDEVADWISFDLDLDLDEPIADEENVAARFTFSLLDQAGEPVPWSTKTSDVSTFSRAIPSWGFEMFIERAELEWSPHLRDDSFSVRCDVAVVDHIRTKTAATPANRQHLKNLGGAVLAGETGGDDAVTFDVDGEVFKVHGSVLAARSPVLRGWLLGTTGMAPTRVRIDMEARVFKAVIGFMYTGSLPEIPEGDKEDMAEDLLEAANMFGMETLKLVCGEMLRGYIDASTVMYTLELAERHGCHGLKEACFEFLRTPSNLKDVVARDGLTHLMSSSHSVV